MQIAQTLAGFTAGEADILRRAMGKKKKAELDKQKERFINGAIKNGIKKDVANFVTENIISWKVSPFKKNIVIKDAKFEFKGDIRINPEWHIYFDEKTVIASWLELEDAILLNNNIQNKPSVINSILKFSDKACVKVNDVKVDGEVFLRNEWTRLIGEPKSSSCFALSETIS